MTYTVKQVMEKYQVSEGTVRHWWQSGQLRALNVGRDMGKGKPRIRFTEQALADFELLHDMSPTPQPTRRRRKKPEGIVEFYK